MTLVHRDGGTAVAGIQCEHIDDTGPCPYDAMHRCTGDWCHGSVYCVRHIRYLNSEYICDTCIRETERFRREEAAAKEKKRIEDAEVAVFLRAIYVTQEKRKIRYPRIMILLSIILFASPFITQSVYANQHPDNPSLVNANPLLNYALVGMAILGLIFFISGWIWVIVIALRRGQKEWAISVFIFTPSLLLYLIFNPVTSDLEP